MVLQIMSSTSCAFGGISRQNIICLPYLCLPKFVFVRGTPWSSRYVSGSFRDTPRPERESKNFEPFGKTVQAKNNVYLTIKRIWHLLSLIVI